MSINELHAGVAAAPEEGTAAPAVLDRNGDGQTTVDELVIALQNAMEGCQ